MFRYKDLGCRRPLTSKKRQPLLLEAFSAAIPGAPSTSGPALTCADPGASWRKRAHLQPSAGGMCPGEADAGRRPVLQSNGRRITRRPSVRHRFASCSAHIATTHSPSAFLQPTVTSGRCLSGGPLS